MVNYLFHEEVRVHYDCSPRGLIEDRSLLYEVISLEGEPYFQLLEENGSPLSPSALRKEQGKMERAARDRRKRRERGESPPAQKGRLNLHLDRLEALQEVRYARPSTWDGRTTWIVETSPRMGSPGRTKKEDMIFANSRATIHVDMETYVPIRIELRMLRDIGAWGARTVLIGEMARLDSGWMIKRLYMKRPLRRIPSRRGSCRNLETEQRFSRFRKFEAESKFYPLDILPN